jgi:hypothetical protein
MDRTDKTYQPICLAPNDVCEKFRIRPDPDPQHWIFFHRLKHSELAYLVQAGAV